MATFRYTAGPWPIHEGNDTFAPAPRTSKPLDTNNTTKTT